MADATALRLGMVAGEASGDLLGGLLLQGIHKRCARLVKEGRLFKAYREQGHGFWAVQRRADGVLVGMCGLFKRPALPEPDIGYALLQAQWGKGLVGEALSAVIDYAFNTLNMNRIEADIDPRNAASAKTLERLGFQKEGYLRERWIVGDEISDTALYGLLQHDWKAEA